MKYRQALVTGGAGFIGSHIVEALLEKGCHVNVIDNLTTGRLENLRSVRNRISFFHGDIRDTRILADAAQGCDVVFHQAAVVSVPKTLEEPIQSAEINELGTLRVLETARQNDVKMMVLASSCAVYGDDPQLPKRETLPPKPKSPYAVHKLTGELHARLYTELYGLKTVSLRYFNVYGPRQDPSSPYSGVISIFLSRALEGQRPVVYGDGRQYRDFIFVKDVVRANLLAAGCPAASGNVYNVGTGSFVRIRDLWEAISERLLVNVDPAVSPARSGDIRESVADVCRAQEDLGFQARYRFDSGLDETLKWYRENQSKPSADGRS